MKKGCVDLHQAVFSTLCGHNLKKVYLKVRNHGEGKALVGLVESNYYRFHI